MLYFDIFYSTLIHSIKLDNPIWTFKPSEFKLIPLKILATRVHTGVCVLDQIRIRTISFCTRFCWANLLKVKHWALSVWNRFLARWKSDKTFVKLSWTWWLHNGLSDKHLPLGVSRVNSNTSSQQQEQSFRNQPQYRHSLYLYII